MELSFWERNSFIGKPDLAVIGSGIVGLNAAITFKKLNPSAHVIVLERGWLPWGASTKNAGFACFGSPSELLSDFESIQQKNVLETVAMRLTGLKKLRARLGDKNIGFIPCGGHEVFDVKANYEYCADQLIWLNKQLKSLTHKKQTFEVSNALPKKLGMKGFSYCILSPLEGQIDTGKMMRSLLQLAQSIGVIVLNNSTVTQLQQLNQGVLIQLENKVEIHCSHLILATNGFARKLIPKLSVAPARTQVLITSPIKKFKLNGVFHYDEGYFYFRNVGERVLLGGGRNLDFEKEATDEFGLTPKIQHKLESLLRFHILPGKEFKIEQRWSGIMGLGTEKKPIIKRISKNVVAAVRMGGMGIAIGTLVGELAVKELMAE
jgi:gamma-glutamylputrescine oxidase